MRERQGLDLRLIISAAVVAAIASALTLNRLSVADVCGSNEAVEGVFVQQMVEHGRLLFPLENGRLPMYKPPLFHWTATSLDHLLGIQKVTAFNLRLPSALYAVAGVVLTFCFGWDLLRSSGAWLAGLILCGSYQFIEQGRLGRVDMTLCFFETLALFAFAWWYGIETIDDKGEAATVRSPPDRREWLRYLFASALGLGVLAKGPVGAILPALACGIFLLAERRLEKLKQIAAPGPILLAMLVGGSWYAACLLARRYGFLSRQLSSENFGRFFGMLGTMPPWYYLKPLLLNSGPLSLIMPVVVFYALWPRKRNHSAPGFDDATPSCGSEPSSEMRTARVPAAVRLFAIFWIVTVVFFTVAAYKRRAYLLPLWPASAIMLAWWVQDLAAKRHNGRLLRGLLVVAAGGLIVFNTVAIPRREVRECVNDSPRHAAMEIDRIVGKAEPLYLHGFGDDPAPLLFYLDRDAPDIGGKLGDAPPGYVIVPVQFWREHQDEALDLMPIFESNSGRPPVVLLRHGRALAIR